MTISCIEENPAISGSRGGFFRQAPFSMITGQGFFFSGRAGVKGAPELRVHLDPGSRALAAYARYRRKGGSRSLRISAPRSQTPKAFYTAASKCFRAYA